LPSHVPGSNRGPLSVTVISLTVLPPPDPAYKGVAFFLVDKSGATYWSSGIISGTDIALQIPTPSSIQDFTLYACGSDGTNVNPIVPGITPASPVTLGSASGTVDPAQLLTEALNPSLAVAGNSFGVATGGITNPLLAALAVASANLQDAAVATSKIADLSVVTSKLAGFAVDSTKLSDLAVTASKLANSSVTAQAIANAAVGSAAIATAAVGTAAIQDLSVVNSKLGFASVAAANIQAASIGTALIADAAISAAKIQDAAITDAKISSLSVNKITGWGGATINLSGTLNFQGPGSIQMFGGGGIYVSPGLVAATAVNINQLNMYGSPIIDTNTVFRGAGVYCPNYGVTAAGFNPYASGVQYFGATLTFKDFNGTTHNVIGGVIVS
jgi:hypothetical protein